MYCRHIRIKATKEQILEECDITSPAALENMMKGWAWAVDSVKHMNDGTKRFYLLDKESKPIGWILDKYVEDIN